MSIVALGLTSCSAAVPSVVDLEVSGAIRLVAAPGSVVSSAADGLPALVTMPGELCVGDVLGRAVIGEGVDTIDQVPSVELAVDCVDFAPQIAFARWSPDASRVAFMGVSEGAESDIWIYDTTGGAVTNVSGDAGEDTLPFWVDDRTVVFLRTEEGISGEATSWQVVSVDSGVPGPLATVQGAVELTSGARVVRGDGPRVLFSGYDADGRSAGIQALDLPSGAITPVWAPTEERAEEGFRLLDIHPEGALALIVLGEGGLADASVEVRLVDLVTGTEQLIAPLFGSGLGDVRFEGDGTRLLVWEQGTDRGDALVVRSTGSDEDAEILLSGELGALGVVDRGVTVDVGTDLVLVRIEP